MEGPKKNRWEKLVSYPPANSQQVCPMIFLKIFPWKIQTPNGAKLSESWCQDLSSKWLPSWWWRLVRPFRFLQGYPIGPYPRIGLPPNDIGPWVAKLAPPQIKTPSHRSPGRRLRTSPEKMLVLEGMYLSKWFLFSWYSWIFWEGKISWFFSRQDAGYAAHILQIPSVALLTTAGPGSMAAAMYLNLNRFSDAIFLRSLCPMHIYIYLKIDMLAKKRFA